MTQLISLDDAERLVKDFLLKQFAASLTIEATSEIPRSLYDFDSEKRKLFQVKDSTTQQQVGGNRIVSIDLGSGVIREHGYVGE